jgi:hypothetical protein
VRDRKGISEESLRHSADSIHGRQEISAID